MENSITGGYVNFYTTGTTNISSWANATRVEVNEYSDYIEMVYKEVSNNYLSVYPPRPTEERVFKIIYSCVDGQWNKSERIYGKILPAKNETYSFE